MSMIKKVLFALLLVASLLMISSSAVEARVRVRGYTRRNGTYVMPHYRTSPNYRKSDNWSSFGNYNPYTGRKGYVQWWR